jgi:hypothetical protein
MRFTTFGAIALALPLVVVAAGCGAKKVVSVESSTTIVSTTTANKTPVSTTSSSAGNTSPKFALSKDCLKLLGADQSLSAAMVAASSGTTGALTKESAELKALAAASPSDIRSDVETIAGTLAAGAAALQNAGLTAGKTPTPAQLAKIAAAEKPLSSAKFKAAAQRIGAWGAKHCSTG